MNSGIEHAALMISEEKTQHDSRKTYLLFIKQPKSKTKITIFPLIQQKFPNKYVFSRLFSFFFVSLSLITKIVVFSLCMFVIISKFKYIFKIKIYEMCDLYV